MSLPPAQTAKLDAREAALLLNWLLVLAPPGDRAKLASMPLDVSVVKQAVGALD